MTAVLEKKTSLANHLTFTSDWVGNHPDTWRKHLSRFTGKPGVRGLEIGVYEGRSAVWWIENILTGPGAKLTTIEKCRERFAGNLQTIRAFGIGPDRLYNIWGVAQDVLSRAHHRFDPLDFAYIDGGKEADNVLQNSVLVWLLLKPGGILIWDDYQWEWKDGSVAEQPSHPPALGIDSFLSAHQGRYTELHRGWQIIIRKNS